MRKPHCCYFWRGCLRLRIQQKFNSMKAEQRAPGRRIEFRNTHVDDLTRRNDTLTAKTEVVSDSTRLYMSYTALQNATRNSG